MVAVVEEPILLPLLVKTADLVVAVLVKQGLLVDLETHLLYPLLKEVMEAQATERQVAVEGVEAEPLLLGRLQQALLAELAELELHPLFLVHL
jgi:hypothetical protein